jgi:hypothetical protein
MKKIAVWMDYSQAKLITFENEVAKTEDIDSQVETHVRVEGEGSQVSSFGAGNFTNNENRNNNRHKNEVANYFKVLSGKLHTYDEILLFGPTNAKDQFKNILINDKAFAKKSIILKVTDKLTENQVVAFAREHMVARQ